MKISRLVIIIAILLIVANRSVSAQDITPQVTIHGVTRSDVMNVVVPEMMANGWTVKSTNDYSVVFSIFKSDFWASVFTGSNSFEGRLMINLIQQGNDVKVSANMHVISYPGTYREQTTPADNDSNRNLQYILSKIKTGFEGATIFGFHYNEKGDYLEIFDVIPGSSFASAGIQKKDRIVSINMKSISKSNWIAINKDLSGDEGSFAMFSIERNGKVNTYRMEKKFIPPIYTKTAQSVTNNQQSPGSFGFKFTDELVGGCVMVSNVTRGSAADAEGMRFGDKITKVNGILIQSYKFFSSAINDTPIGSDIEFTVRDDSGNEKVIKLFKVK